jgi:hypothetical protein
MVAMALNAAGDTSKNADLLNGLLLFTTGANDGFIYSAAYGNTFNAMSTRNGFLGLIALAGERNVLDFTGTAAAAAAIAGAAPAGCPVRVLGVPSDAAIEVKLGSAVQTPHSAGRYVLAAGDYTYTASKSGYVTGTGSFTVTADEAANRIAESVSFDLSADELATEYVYTTVIGPAGALYSRQPMTWVSGMTPLSALYNTGLAVVNSGGYVSSVAGIAEFDYGATSGWLFEVNGDESILQASNLYTLSADDELVWFYTCDYTEEEGSGTWSETQIKPITVNPVTPTVTYSDVSEDDRFYEAVNWVVGEGLFNGISKTNFAPNDAMTRGMLATVLWRLADEDTAEGETSAQFDFSDVLHGAWYSDAANWAAGNNMMGGYGNGLFGTCDSLTNEQLAVILWRYAGCPAASVSSSIGGVSDWAVNAMDWAMGNDLFNSEDDSALNPGKETTRAETADILMRFAALIKQ